MLHVQGLYENIVDCPGFFDMKGKAKWNAWSSRKGEEVVLSLFSEINN